MDSTCVSPIPSRSIKLFNILFLFFKLNNFSNSLMDLKKPARILAFSCPIYLTPIEKINFAKESSEKTVIEKTQKFHQLTEDRKKNIEIKINQMKENALKDIKNSSIKVSIEAVKHLIKNSIDKEKLEKLYSKNIEQIKTELKQSKF